MRPASMSDADRLFSWRNDSATQAASRSTAPVLREDHDRWMQFHVMQGYPQHLVMIADTDKGPVGCVRFDGNRRDVMKFEVSITIAPQWRGNGLALPVLQEACGHMSDYTLDAVVRRNNVASRRLFERCGFEEIGRKNGFVEFRKEPTR